MAPPPIDELTVDPSTQLWAVQQRRESVAPAWRGFPNHPAHAHAPFHGATLIVNREAAQLCEATWDECTDDAADTTLTRLSLRRLEDWTPDLHGRRVTQVAALPSPDHLTSYAPAGNPAPDPTRPG